MKIVPKRDQVVIELDVPKEMSDGGIVIPQTAQDAPQTGKVVSVGPGTYADGIFVPVEGIDPGDTVLFKQWQPVEVKVAGEKFFLLPADSILAVIVD